ncbi:MAG: hypothetical protein IJ348_03050 [Alistipes sp.]|nr:hypothetical protein [Alistipes sp.]
MKFRILLVATFALLMTSCYNDFDMPPTPTVYDDASFEEANPELTHISIADLKALFGNTSGTGDTGSQAATKYIRFVNDASECNSFELSKGWYVAGKNYYIKGRIISNDEQGNIYKSLYIFDGTGAIELKLTNGLYLDYYCDLDKMESQWVYVKVTGLYLGNFRMMLSLGDIPTSSFNSWGTYKYYANSNIVSPNKVREHVFHGERCKLTEGTADTDDIYVVDASSYSKIQGNNTPKFLGRLVRFKGLKVMYKGVMTNEKDANGEYITPAPLKNGQFDQLYPTWLCTSGLKIDGTYTQVVNQPWYRMAYSRNNVSLYGSLCVGYNENAVYTSDHGVYTVRTSGYSRFAGKYLPKNGEVGDVLAIYTIYSKQSNYRGGSSDYSTYQLSLVRYKDFGFKTEPTTESAEWSNLIRWADDNYPSYMLYPSDDNAREGLVQSWRESIAAMKPADDGSALWQEWNEWCDWCVWTIENTPEESWTLPEQINEDDDMGD